MDLPLITIGFASHRLETLAAVLALMQDSQAVILEEAPEPDFAAALSGALAPEVYLEDKDPEFPHFSRVQLEALGDLARRGQAILQVEPYLERLIRIHELLAGGVPRPEVEAQEDLAPVYAAEHRATASLLAFYTSAHGAPFAKVVAAVRTFARDDAARLRLRDELRARAIADLAGRYGRIFIEAGYIHLFLIMALKAMMQGSAHLKPLFVQAGLSCAALRLPRPLGPGDLLTLHDIFGTALPPAQADLLAARSLIYIQLLEKGELAPAPDNPTPHLDDEIRAYRLTRSLTYQDCARLYPLVRRASPATTREVVADFLKKKG